MVQFTEEIKNSILGNNIKTFEDAFHGYIIVIDNSKVFKTDSGIFIFNTEDQAKQAFYSKYRKLVSSVIGDESLNTWGGFKTFCHYNIQHI